MSETLGLGRPIPEGTTHQRDAIHIAVMPVTVQHGVQLLPGAAVRFVANSDGATVCPVGRNETPVGVIDPFLHRKVHGGERVWLFLNPGSITSLRHDWTHPEVDRAAVEFVKDTITGRAESVNWVAAYAQSIGDNYDDLMEGARAFANDKSQWGEFYSKGGLFEGVSLDPDFWGHYEKIERVELPEGKKQSFFSCSC